MMIYKIQLPTTNLLKINIMSIIFNLKNKTGRFCKNIFFNFFLIIHFVVHFHLSKITNKSVLLPEIEVED